jgi:arylsulfatase A-like enzyme
VLPPNVPPHPGDPNKPSQWPVQAWSPPHMYRHYLAMTLALDDMLGQLMEYLERTGRLENTLVVFTSDHGTEGGARGANPWRKMTPYEESVRVPMVLRLPGVLPAGQRSQAMLTPVDILPTLCGFCGVPIPRTVEGHDLSGAIMGRQGAYARDAALLMNFTASHDYLVGGQEFRAVRTHGHTYVRRLDGRTELYDLAADPLQMKNLADDPAAAALRQRLGNRLGQLMAELGDEMLPAEAYGQWLDAQRRIIRNARGPLGNPEAPPDFSALG